MLRQILERVSQGGTWSVAVLADELDTTPQLVEAALDELARRGYLKPVGAACSSACASCPLGGSCAKRPGERVWSLAGPSQG
jgi:hypothetical protein